MSYKFLGDFPLTYPAYRDAETDHTLAAVPYGEYDIEPAAGRDLPVPPDDGRWEPVTADPPPDPPAVADVTTATTEDEGNTTNA